MLWFVHLFLWVLNFINNKYLYVFSTYKLFQLYGFLKNSNKNKRWQESHYLAVAPVDCMWLCCPGRQMPERSGWLEVCAGWHPPVSRQEMLPLLEDHKRKANEEEECAAELNFTRMPAQCQCQNSEANKHTRLSSFRFHAFPWGISLGEVINLNLCVQLIKFKWLYSSFVRLFVITCKIILDTAWVSNFTIDLKIAAISFHMDGGCSSRRWA